MWEPWMWKEAEVGAQELQLMFLQVLVSQQLDMKSHLSCRKRIKFACPRSKVEDVVPFHEYMSTYVVWTVFGAFIYTLISYFSVASSFVETSIRLWAK